MITSSSNVQIKNLAKLQKSAKERKEQKAFVIEGEKLFKEANALGIIKKAYVSEVFFEEKQVIDKDYFQNISYEIVTEKVFKEVSDTMTPQGILAIVKSTQYKLEELLEKEEIRFLLLENIRDPGNLGTMLRTAEGAGMTGVILSKESVDMQNPKVIRATMGAIFRLPFVYVEDFQETLKLLQKKDIMVYATDLDGKNNYDEEKYQDKIGIIIGNEANGISEQSRNEAGILIKIPMSGQVESLNASVAAAIVMYEVFRQRRN